MGGLGDPAGDPGPDGSGLDEVPEPGQAVPEVEGVADQGGAGSVRHLPAGAELGRAELLHRRGPGAAEARPAAPRPAGAGPVAVEVSVQVGPAQRDPQPGGLGGVGGGSTRSARSSAAAAERSDRSVGNMGLIYRNSTHLIPI